MQRGHYELRTSIKGESVYSRYNRLMNDILIPERIIVFVVNLQEVTHGREIIMSYLI